ncbi:nucleolar protein 10-like [Actinia tenebrosa]|uniref:Nucleolar protein 10 n=1 Tax=Actinia tenebrosa TaxID=6105 RepID=A0A6P8ITT1_ACTTE|nr:nucleolar protein 10-like [Actinia tenebrosa]
MQVSQPNNVKIYNLSAGKSLPEWLSERKRRTLQKNDIDIRRRIELIQEFEMPTASTNIQVSSDKEYIMATGVYKPRVRCFETSQLSMKFERCLDSDVVKFCILSEDYSKMVFLQSDRYVEFHVQYGRYYRTRIPRFGRDLTYHKPSCDLYLVGAGPEIYRLNLDQGKFLNPLKTDAAGINVCDMNPVHQLFAAGTTEGRVECWDPRSRSRVGVLDVGLSGITQDRSDYIPSVTALKYRDGLTMGVGTATGHVLLYDLRSSHPLLVKDHQYGLPINSLSFQDKLGVVLSTDSKILKIWDRETGKPFTSIEPQTNINDLCVFPDSGLLFMATEAPKMLVYYIPSLGPAPRWCSFLDNLTEELEEDQQPTVYDDYKFVTKDDLEKLGLNHLIGTNLLRAYMHGYFMDIRLYQKAKTIAEPFAFEEYRKKKIQEKIDEERENRVRIKKLPRINRALAEKLLEEKPKKDKKLDEKGPDVSNPLGDDRFAAMFKNPDFQVDQESEEFKLLHPVMSKHDKRKSKKSKQLEDKKQQQLLSQFDEVEELEGRPSSEESSSDDEHTWREEQRKELKKNTKKSSTTKQPKFYEFKQAAEYKSMHSVVSSTNSLQNRVSLGDRLRKENNSKIIKTTGSSVGEMEMTFSLKKDVEETKRQKERKEHREERKKVRRSAGNLMAGEKKKPVFWRGKRVK